MNMSNKKGTLTQKDTGSMETVYGVLIATQQMDLQLIRRSLELKPDSFNDTDTYGNNAVHYCVGGLLSLRAPHVLKFFLEETDINLLHRNFEGMDPLDLAISINDEYACQLIEPYWNKQISKRISDEEKLRLKPVSPRPNGP